MKKLFGLVGIFFSTGLLFTGCEVPKVTSTETLEAHRAMPLLPGAFVFDVTDARFGAVPDDGKDDTKAIQAAIEAAAAHEKSEKGRYYQQQVIYLPEGTYEISDTLACVMNNGNPAHIGRFCRQLVQAMGGKIKVESQPNQGNSS